MIVSVLEAGFLWRVRVPQGPATRHETITSVLSVVQVRSAILWLLRQRLLQCPSHKSRPLALVYLLNWVGCDSPLVSRKLTEAHVRQCLGTSNANSKGSDYSFRPQASYQSVDPHLTTGSISAAQYGTLLGECSHCTSAARV